MRSKNFTKGIFVIECDIEVRYWNDAKVNGCEDTDMYTTQGKGIPTIPCAVQIKNEPDNVIYSNHWRWRPIINIERGQIINWQRGVTAIIHYKVCDGFACSFVGVHQEIITKFEGYVPSFMYPDENGYGDYIIMKVDGNGCIDNWNVSKVQNFLDTEFC